MNITLKKLTIRNFKGFKHFEFAPNEKIAKVFGDNGRGKTSLYDAFSWCLFGKDSQSRADFGMKPLDQFNVEIPRLENEVEALLSVGNKDVLLKRVQSEKWTKRRGTKEEVFDGNTTAYFFNNVPVAKKEFEKRIEQEIISESIFRLITNLNEFAGLHWKKKRDVLFEIVGEVSDVEVEMSNDDLNGFINMLNGSSLEDFKKTVAAKIKKIKDEKKKIPVRIDEVDRNKPIAPNMPIEQIDAEIAMHQEVIKETESSLNDIGSRNKTIERNLREIANLKQELIKIETDANYKIKSERDQLARNKSGVQIQIDDAEKQISRYEQDIANYQQRVNGLLETTQKLRETYGQVESRVFQEPDRSTMICNCCGQSLPTDNIEQTINTMRTKHHDNIQRELNDIRSKGQANNKQIETYKEDIKVFEQKIAEQQEFVIGFVKEIDSLNMLLSKPVVEITDFSANKKHVEITNKIAALEKQAAQTEDTSALNGLITQNQHRIIELNKVRDIYSQIESFNARRNELLEEESKLSEQLMKLEQQEFMCEEFMRTKVDMVEEKINSLFDFVRFKMFETQVNGATVETCKALVNTNGSLVPYEIANTAGQINAGIDIVNTLSRHYGITAPIFVDHNESITKMINSESQLIGLYVSEQHEELTVQ